MMLVEVSITPIGKGESVSKWVARAVDVIDRSGLPYRLGPMGTCIEGTWEGIARVLGQCLKAVSRDCSRVSISLKGDFRRGPGGRLDSKVISVQRKLNRPVRT